RHDQYSDVGGTSNAKLAFNWNPFDALTIRGGWGQSFRAPNFGEFSPISNVTWDGWNLGNVYTQNPANLSVLCVSGAPPAGSGADKLFQAGFGCNSTPGGLSIGPGGFAPVAVGLRDFTNTTQRVLDPEKSVNWSIGFDYTPTGFLTGLNIPAWTPAGA
ncbi:MAG TPA: TonB-dependent receptor, partial [Burkholderiales bacterium]